MISSKLSKSLRCGRDSLVLAEFYEKKVQSKQTWNLVMGNVRERRVSSELAVKSLKHSQKLANLLRL